MVETVDDKIAHEQGLGDARRQKADGSREWD